MVIAMLLMCSKADGQTLRKRQHKFLPRYSSASALAWHEGALYVMGDDAPTLLVLNKKLKEKEQRRVFDDTTQRIPYGVKPDLEAATLLTLGNNITLWLFPSFSAPNRNTSVKLDIGRSGATPELLTLAPFATGRSTTNIEGAEIINNQLLLANRANSLSPGHFLFGFDLSKQIIPAAPERTYAVQLPATKEIVGLSGMFYLKKWDWLLLTVSTEVAATATRDGRIGPSYLAIVEKVSQQLSAGTELVADTLLPLAQVLHADTPMKIESVTATRVRQRKAELVLAADNDNGTTHLFRISFKRRR